MRERFDYTLPHNARKLEAADALGALADEAGIPLVELALAWVINHPGITAAIVGARTVEHLEGQLPAASRKLDSALLDRIDEIVPPGTNFRRATTATTTRRSNRGAQKVMAPGGHPGRPASLAYRAWVSSAPPQCGQLARST